MLRFVVLLLASILNYSACYSASTNQQAAEQGATWLSQNQNPDGSWGTTPDVRFHSTAEAVMAFAALGNRTTAYWSGIAWLENHQAKKLRCGC
jgi:squalene cyclase